MIALIYVAIYFEYKPLIRCDIKLHLVKRSRDVEE
jgi:hypothetical protein